MSSSVSEFLYTKTHECPVCRHNIEEYTVKQSKLRYVSSEMDLRPIYKDIEPLFYDVIHCLTCGYAAPIQFFDQIKPKGAQKIVEFIWPKFKPKHYPAERTVKDAIERYTMSRICAEASDSPISQLGYIAMKTAWMFRIAGHHQKELEFIKKAMEHFHEAFMKESFPICGMNEETFSYVHAAFYKLLGNNSEALKWLSKVVVKRNINPRLKDKALDLKVEIQEELKKAGLPEDGSEQVAK